MGLTIIMSVHKNTNFKKVIDIVYTLAYTKLLNYLTSTISLLTVIIAPGPSTSATHTNLSPFLSCNNSTRAEGTTVVIDPLTNPAFVLYVIFIYPLIFSFYIYFYILPYINLFSNFNRNPYGIYMMKFNFYIEIFKESIGRYKMKNRKLQLLCMCAGYQFKKVSWIKINFIENGLESYLLKTEGFQNNLNKLFQNNSMIFSYFYSYLYVSISLLKFAKKLVTSGHIRAMNVSKSGHIWSHLVTFICNLEVFHV